MKQDNQSVWVYLQDDKSEVEVRFADTSLLSRARVIAAALTGQNVRISDPQVVDFRGRVHARL